jgi:hypothetical protein
MYVHVYVSAAPEVCGLLNCFRNNFRKTTRPKSGWFFLPKKNLNKCVITGLLYEITTIEIPGCHCG